MKAIVVRLSASDTPFANLLRTADGATPSLVAIYPEHDSKIAITLINGEVYVFEHSTGGEQMTEIEVSDELVEAGLRLMWAKDKLKGLLNMPEIMAYFR